ncbi:MAG: hypothetical protein N2690_08430 [Rhodocyclaceae bacterium]|nr:hypothetical protein [Rhodocyclaceae bacterium]
MWHPAALLVTWLAFAVLLQRMTVGWLVPVAAATLAIAFRRAPQRSRRLLWRARWLLLSLAILFLFFTPGEYLGGGWGALGITYEGLRHAGEQLARLVAMLASLAWLHERLGTFGLLAGFHSLLAPFPGRERTVVRLILVLESVENAPRADWRSWLAPPPGSIAPTERLTLPAPRFRRRDGALVAFAIMVLLGVLAG